MSELPQFSMRDLIEAGAHFGHRTKRWNPRMAPYLFGVRNNIHIIDLQQTVPMLHRALTAIRDTVSAGGRVLFVGTKRQASDFVAESAKRCGQYYVNHRWLGGMLTNWSTVSQSIKRLRKIEHQLADETLRITKKERLNMDREREKLERALGGIKDMGGLPDLLFVIDTNKEDLAVTEARRLGIPVVAIVDSNSDPNNISYPVPANDDAARSIQLYCRLVSDAVLAGIQDELVKSGVDIGASAAAAKEKVAAAQAAAASPADNAALEAAFTAAGIEAEKPAKEKGKKAKAAEASAEEGEEKKAKKSSKKAAKPEVKVETKKSPKKAAKED